MKTFIGCLAIALCVGLATAQEEHRGKSPWSDLTPEEQALLNKGEVMEMYKPDEHSRHFITHMDAVADSKTGKPRKTENPAPVLCFVFGMEDAEAARKEGRSMAEFHYSRAQTHEFLFAQGWDKYHDRFFTRAYVQEGEDAYDEALKSKGQKASPFG